MTHLLNSLPIDEKIQLVEDIWDSIATDQSKLQLTKEQKSELDIRLNAYQLDENKGREASIVIRELKKRL